MVTGSAAMPFSLAAKASRAKSRLAVLSTIPLLVVLMLGTLFTGALGVIYDEGRPNHLADAFGDHCLEVALFFIV